MSLSSLIVFALLIVGGLVLWGVLIYNGLVKLKNVTAEAWSGIDVQLQRRAELIPNLVELTREYKTYEADVLSDITATRADPRSTPHQRAAKENVLTEHLRKLIAVAEEYPDLKAGDLFSELHESLVDTENQIQYARRYYNGAVRDLNSRIESFPDMIIAERYDFETAEFFKIELASQKEPPKLY